MQGWQSRITDAGLKCRILHYKPLFSRKRNLEFELLNFNISNKSKWVKSKILIPTYLKFHKISQISKKDVRNIELIKNRISNTQIDLSKANIANQT